MNVNRRAHLEHSDPKTGRKKTTESWKYCLHIMHVHIIINICVVCACACVQCAKRWSKHFRRAAERKAQRPSSTGRGNSQVSAKKLSPLCCWQSLHGVIQHSAQCARETKQDLELKQRNQWQQKQSIENLWPGQVSFKLFNRTKPNIDALQNDPRLPLDVKGVDC